MENKEIVANWLGIKGMDLDTLSNAIVVNLFVNKLISILDKDSTARTYFEKGNTDIILQNSKVFVLANDVEAVLETAAAYVEWDEKTNFEN